MTKKIKKTRLRQEEKILIDLKPSVKKKLRNWFPLLKYLLIFVILYYVSQIAVRTLIEMGVLRPGPKSSVLTQKGNVSLTKTKTIWRPQPDKELKQLPEPVLAPIRKKRVLSPTLPKLVFVIDDMGYTVEHRELLIRLGDNVTYAILPVLSHSQYFSLLSLSTQAEVILHLPLETEDGTIPGPGLITSRMTTPHIQEMLQRDLQSVPQLMGVSNHMGSLGTSDSRLMELILSELKNKNLFFLDSHTTPRTVGRMVGKKIGIPVLDRHVFLDNVDEETAITNQIEELKKIAQRQGYAIGIGHYRPLTLKVLSEEIPLLKQENFEIVSLSDIINFKKMR